MDAILRQALLFDFYGDLLTAHQKEAYALYLTDDLSVSEIAAEKGISRQGAHDLIKRCQHILEEYEETLQLANRFISVRKKVQNIEAAAEEALSLPASAQEALRHIADTANEILKEL